MFDYLWLVDYPLLIMVIVPTRSTTLFHFEQICFNIPKALRINTTASQEVSWAVGLF